MTNNKSSTNILQKSLHIYQSLFFNNSFYYNHLNHEIRVEKK